MNYELAKELKDAGFPHDDWRPGYAVEPSGKKREIMFNNPPTLSELVEACGEGFAYLSRIERIPGGTSWTCGSWDEEHSCTDKDCCEDAISEPTPEEAVARLWLALNKP